MSAENDSKPLEEVKTEETKEVRRATAASPRQRPAVYFPILLFSSELDVANRMVLSSPRRLPLPPPPRRPSL